MASIKEEVMTVKDDCQYVRALDANGNSIRISKEDLAKVLGELIGIDSSWFRSKNDVSTSFDNCTESGCYVINKSTYPSATNYPPEVVYGLLLVFSSRNGWISQLAHNLENNAVYVRIRTESSTWRIWEKL